MLNLSFTFAANNTPDLPKKDILTNQEKINALFQSGLSSDVIKWSKFRNVIPDKELMEKVLRSYDPIFNEAMQLCEQGHPSDFLFKSEHPYSSYIYIARCLAVYKRYYLARCYMLNGEYEDAYEVLSELVDETAFNCINHEILLQLGICCSKIIDPQNERIKYLAKAKLFFKTIESDKPSLALGLDPKDCPESVREAAYWMRRELEEDFNPGSLEEIARRMDDIKHGIENERTGQQIQGRQEHLIKDLDELIRRKLIVEQKKSKLRMGEDEKEKEKTEDEEEQSRSGKGESDNQRLKKRRDLKDSEGILRNYQRAEVYQNLMSKFPFYYRELVENYYKSLAKSGNYKTNNK